SAGAGRGTEFTVRLPLREAAAAAAADAGGAAARVNSRRVLIVDDNRDGAESLGILLRASGHEVRTAYSGGDAVAAAEAFAPEAVLLDIGLPGMDGYEVAARLRQQPSTAAALLVALTGYGQEEDRRRALEAGFDQHFVKPIDPDSLEQLLRRPC